MFSLFRSQCTRKCTRVKQNLTFTTQLFLLNCNKNITKIYIYLLYIFIAPSTHIVMLLHVSPSFLLLWIGYIEIFVARKTEKQQKEHAQQKIMRMIDPCRFYSTLNISRYYSCIVYKHLVTIDSDNFIPQKCFLRENDVIRIWIQIWRFKE